VRVRADGEDVPGRDGEAGIVSKYNDIKQRGVIASSDGRTHRFRFTDGQNMMSGDDLVVPRFTGRHDQPPGFRLKVPRVGDAVIFTAKPRQGYITWGYMQHYLYLVERKHGSEFLATKS